MIDLNRQTIEIRQFLLGLMQEKKAERLEERIFADPDFAGEVEAVESELIVDYRAETLSPEERLLFEQKYLKTAAGLEAVEYESVFHEFIQAKLRENAPLQEEPPGRVATVTATAGKEMPPASPEETKPEGGMSWLKQVFTGRPVFGGLMAAACLLLLAIGFWYTWRLIRPSGDDSMWAERRVREAGLARLNTNVALAANLKDGLSVDLRPMQRGGGTITRLAISDLSQGDLIKLRLSLTQSGAEHYRAVFLDDQRNELFAVANLTAQNTPDGPQIHLLVPATYFKSGDYQISLSASNKNGGYEELNSYALRVVESR
jgi:hypothetical protein